MNPIVKKDNLNVLRQAADAVKSGEMLKLRELSDHVIHNASVFQDKDSITLAVTVYACSKLYKYGRDIDKFVLPRISRAIAHLEAGKDDAYGDEMKAMLRDISTKYAKARIYIQEVLVQAQVSKASRMYEHGISLPQVAEALGISQWEIMDYVGKKGIVDQFAYKEKPDRKLEAARRIFLP